MNINIESEIISVIDIEMKGISLLREHIDSSVKSAVETIFNCRGKVILTGMGKSGLVAKKKHPPCQVLELLLSSCIPQRECMAIWGLLPLKILLSLLEKAGKALN